MAGSNRQEGEAADDRKWPKHDNRSRESSAQMGRTDMDGIESKGLRSIRPAWDWASDSTCSPVPCSLVLFIRM